VSKRLLRNATRTQNWRRRCSGVRPKSLKIFTIHIWCGPEATNVKLCSSSSSCFNCRYETSPANWSRLLLKVMQQEQGPWEE